MQSISLRLAKRLSDSSNSHWKISSNLIAHASTTSSSPSPPSPPFSAATNATASTLNNLLTSPWSASQTRGLTFSGSDVRVGNLIENRGRAYEVLKLYNSHEGTGKAAIKVPPHTVAGYATVATATEDDIKRGIRLVLFLNLFGNKRNDEMLEGAKQWIEESRPKDKERATPKNYGSCSSSFNIPECLFIARGKFLPVLAHKRRN